MPRITSQVEQNTFIGGFTTEASPMTFPDFTSINEQNFILNRDGSRDRRLGMDFEEGYEAFSFTGVDTKFTGSFIWEQPGGDSEKQFVVVQIDNVLHVLDALEDSISANKLWSVGVGSPFTVSKWSFASVDGILIVAVGQSFIVKVVYDGTNFVLETFHLKIRDFFGLADVTSLGVDLTAGNNVNNRQTQISSPHLYNLRNQTWGLPRITDRDLYEDVLTYIDSQSTVWPSNADNIWNWMLSDPDDVDGRKEFNYPIYNDEPSNASRSALGFFIIDALDRGTSRVEQLAELYATYPELSINIDPNFIPTDKTEGGATVVSQYAGRMWYSGFSNELTDGDTRSPRLGSYVLFSKIIQSESDFEVCYQTGDPTSEDEPDLIDTDGGLIKLDGAYNINNLVNVSNVLIVFAENGVWMIRGGSGYGFVATNYEVTKISEHGCISTNSVVVVDSTIAYWGQDAMYHLAPDQFDSWSATNISSGKIQKYYDAIPFINKTFAEGYYDSYDRKMRWLFNNRIGFGTTEEIVYDIDLQAWYRSVVDSSGPRILGAIEVPPYRVGLVDGIRSATREIKYLTQYGIDFTFSSYSATTFRDWDTFYGTGVDAEAFMITGYLTGGDTMRRKEVPYVMFNFLKTENGFYDPGDGNWLPKNPSGCLVQFQYDWNNTPAGNKWSKEFQAYKIRRSYMPEDLNDDYDTGQLIVTSKNRVRGYGRALSILIKSVPAKDCRILGWSHYISAEGRA